MLNFYMLANLRMISLKYNYLKSEILCKVPKPRILLVFLALFGTALGSILMSKQLPHHSNLPETQSSKFMSDTIDIVRKSLEDNIIINHIIEKVLKIFIVNNIFSIGLSYGFILL